MQTINIQNCTDFKDKFFKIIVNGEKHVMRHQFLIIHLSDNKPLKIKAKYFVDSSSEYTFEPNENISLQVFMNQRLLRWTWLAWFVVYIFSMLVIKIHDNLLYASIFLIVMVIFEAFKSKRYFVIKEIKTIDN